MTAGVAQQAEGEQRGQGAEHAAVGDVVGGFKGRFGVFELAEGGGDALHGAGGGDAHWCLAIRDTAGALGGGRGGLGGVVR